MKYGLLKATAGKTTGIFLNKRKTRIKPGIRQRSYIIKLGASGILKIWGGIRRERKLLISLIDCQGEVHSFPNYSERYVTFPLISLTSKTKFNTKFSVCTTDFIKSHFPPQTSIYQERTYVSDKLQLFLL